MIITAKKVCVVLVGLASVLFFISIGTPNWVEAGGGDFSWGLWAYCNNTVSPAVCDVLDNYEMEGYFQAARVLSIIAVVGYVLIIATGVLVWVYEYERHEWGGKYDTTHFTFLVVTQVLVLIAFMVIKADYKDDALWSSQGPVLGYSYWLSGFVCFLTSIVYLTHSFCWPWPCCCKRPSSHEASVEPVNRHQRQGSSPDILRNNRSPALEGSAHSLHTLDNNVDAGNTPLNIPRNDLPPAQGASDHSPAPRAPEASALSPTPSTYEEAVGKSTPPSENV